MAARQTYALYGLSLRSEWALPCCEGTEAALPRVDLFEAPAHLFSAASTESEKRTKRPRWSHYLPLPDGSEYLRWTRLFEFLVSPDGSRIAGRPLADATSEAFQTYLLGQVLSHALIKLGFEPIHATVVEVGGEAVGFMGDSGLGKSTLAAAFVRVGFRLLTDDLLILKENGPRLYAYPGLPRIKLFPEMARTVFGEQVQGTPMNPMTPKLVIPLDRTRCVRDPIAMREIYVLQKPWSARGTHVKIQRASPRRAFLELLRNTYNRDVVERQRMKRQLFLQAQLALNVPFKLLSFPRRLSALPAVHSAILSGLRPAGEKGTRPVSAPFHRHVGWSLTHDPIDRSRLGDFVRR